MSGKKSKDKNANNQSPQENEVSKVQKERDEYLAGWQRERADFANYKKDVQKYIEDIRKNAKSGAVLEMLPIFDNIDLVVQHIPENIKEQEQNWYQGVEFVYSEFKHRLSELGLKEISCEVGQEFNPSLHEVVEGEGTVIQEVMVKGYMLNDAVIRHAKVKVAGVARDNQNNNQDNNKERVN